MDFSPSAAVIAGKALFRRAAGCLPPRCRCLYRRITSVAGASHEYGDAFRLLGVLEGVGKYLLYDEAEPFLVGIDDEDRYPRCRVDIFSEMKSGAYFADRLFHDGVEAVLLYHVVCLVRTRV